VGWTQEEIGEVVGLSQRRVGQKLEDLENLLKLLKSLLDRGDSVSDVAGKLKIDLTPT
jgi:ParB-like chromosome segregation protein Spo0J